jgi:hypothetical protein
MWGLSLQFWQSVVLWTNIAALVAGVITGAALFVSAWVSSSIADIIQQDADRRIAEAQTKGEEAREGAAKANERAAKTEERAAQLERENLEIREKVAGRRISKLQHDTIVKSLSSEPVTFDMQVMQESETALFAADILKTLTDAGWTVDKKELPLGVVWTNLNISLTDDPAAARLAAAFQIAGVPFGIGNERHARVTIIVGGKPSPF